MPETPLDMITRMLEEQESRRKGKLKADLPSPQIESIFRTKLLPKKVFPQSRPIALLIAGQPGSGKTTALEKLVRQIPELYSGGVVSVDLDVIAEMHPHYDAFARINERGINEKVAATAGKLAEMLLRHSVENRYNVTLPIFDREGDRSLVGRLRDDGYRLVSAFLAVDHLTSRQGITLRSLNSRDRHGYARLTDYDPGLHWDNGVLNLADRADRRKDEVYVIRRDGDVLCRRPAGRDWNDLPTRDIITKVRNQPWTPERQRKFRSTAQDIDAHIQHLGKPEEKYFNEMVNRKVGIEPSMERDLDGGRTSRFPSTNPLSTTDVAFAAQISLPGGYSKTPGPVADRRYQAGGTSCGTVRPRRM